MKSHCVLVVSEEFCAREASQILGGRSYLRGNHIGGRIERCWREARFLDVTVVVELVNGHQSFALFRDLARDSFGGRVWLAAGSCVCNWRW